MGYDIDLFIPQPGQSLQESHDSQCKSLAPDKNHKVAASVITKIIGPKTSSRPWWKIW